MKIYQVEEIVGITKKNIRFYEDEGLLNPERNPENGYRDYTLKDVRQLQKIKLLRKLSVPIEEIRLLEKGDESLAQILNRQIDRLTQEQKNAEFMKNFCEKLSTEITDLNSLDPAFYLSEMKNLEKGGAEFMDIENKDIKRKKKYGAVIAATVFCLIMLIPFGAMIYAIKEVGEVQFPMVLMMIIMGIVITGTIIALVMRLKEIKKGEEFEALKY